MEMSVLKPNSIKLLSISLFNPLMSGGNKMVIHTETKNFLKIYGPFSGWGSTASRLEPLRGGSLLFTSKFPEIPCDLFVTTRH